MTLSFSLSFLSLSRLSHSLILVLKVVVVKAADVGARSCVFVFFFFVIVAALRRAAATPSPASSCSSSSAPACPARAAAPPGRPRGSLAFPPLALALLLLKIGGPASSIGLVAGLATTGALMYINVKRTTDLAYDDGSFPGPKAWPAVMSLITFFCLMVYVQALGQDASTAAPL